MSSSSSSPDDSVWQDREIRFDVGFAQLKPRRGEVEIDSINSVEDTKGNNGEKGALSITNLRIIWASHKDPRTNLSIGLNCIQSVNIRTAASRLRGNTQGLYVMTKFNNSRFEFIFTSLVKNSPRLFTTVQAIFKSYETTKLYRDLKLRGAIIKDKQLLMLPDEEVYSKVDGAWNLSSDQGNLGTFFVTSVRLVWHANLAENFNVSIPYLQIKAIKVRDSKFGHALVIETSARSGGYILGFRIDPVDKLNEVYKEIRTLHEVYSTNPVFGIKFSVEEKPQALDERKIERKQDDVEIIEDEHYDVLAAYYADGSGVGTGSADKPPVYNNDLGLAIEPLKEGVSIEELWNVST
jgi:Bardet-Biedl syndrome 5 protein